MAKSRKRKKSSNKVAQKFSENSFLKHQLRKLPVDTCYIMGDWQETGQTAIVIMRKHVNEKYSAAAFYIDLLCRGIIDTYYLINLPKSEIEELLAENDEICPYSLAHNIIWGAVGYAEELGLKPHNDFIKTQYFLEEDTDDIEFIDIEFGKSNRPVVIIDNKNKNYKLIKTLDKTIGRENYDILDLNKEYDLFDTIPLDYDELGFFSREEMIEELLERNSQEEIDEFFELFFEMSENGRNIDFKNIPENYEPVTVVRIIETMYFIAKSPNQMEEQDYQELYAQLFFDDIPDSPFDMTDEKISYNVVDLGINKSDAEKEAHKQLIIKLHAGKNIDKELNKQIKLFPDNPAFKALWYRQLFQKNRIRKIRKYIEEDYNKSPEYLFFKLYFGELLLQDKNYEKIYEIFDNKTSLSALYPERSVFHISEFVGFCQFHIEFNIAMDKIEIAVQYYDALTKYHVDGNEELMAYIAKKVLKAKTEFLSSINIEI